MNLLKKINNIHNYYLFGKCFISNSKQNISIYNIEYFELLYEISFERYPKILHIDDKSIYIQEKNKIIEVDYCLTQKKLYVINIPNIWMLNYLSDNYILIKQEIDREKDHFLLLNYNFKERNIIWKFQCNNYKYSFFNQTHLIIDKGYKKKIQCIDMKSGVINWEIDIKSNLQNYYPSDYGVYQILTEPFIYKKILFIQLQNLESNVRYLTGYDIKSGKIIWFKQGFNNFEIYKNKLYNIEFHGLFRILNPKNGKIIREVDLQEEFKRMSINCEHRFKVTDTHIYFKHAIKGKVGILNIDTLEIEEVIQLPDNNTLSTDEIPTVQGDRIYIRSTPQNNLFIYQRN